MKSIAGQLLIASPKLIADPNFDRTVVLIVQHNDEGALGLILNRPTDMTVDMVWDQISDTPCLSSAVLFQGGPCERTLMVLHSDMSLSDAEVMPGVYFTTSKENVEQLVAGDADDRPARFFVGYAGWGPTQLEGEIEAGAWLNTPASAEHIFEADQDLWDILRRRISLQASYPWLKATLIPDDPTMN